MRDRHSALETVVFGLAGLLALILAYYTYARWSAARPSRPAAPAAAQPESATAPSDDEDTGPGVGFSGGGSVPTVRFTPLKKRAKK